MKKAFLLLLVLTFVSCATRSAIKEEPIESLPPPEAIEVQPNYLTIVAAGDNIIHDPILKACLSDGVYSFDSIYKQIREYITPADIAFVNQETILGNSALGYSGYPLFSTPREVGSALAAAGFSVVGHATNHAMDKGEAGVISTIEHWDFIGKVSYLGINRSEEERMNRRVIIKKNNISVGFLAYTYGTNGIPLPKDKPYLVALAEKRKMADEIDSLRPLCDYLVVSMHWGEEYRQDYSEIQKGTALFLAEHEVDLVIGHHPHVLEPFEIYKRPDGGTITVFYSLGNFFSAHARPVNEALLGGLMYIKLKKHKGETSIEEVGVVPVVTHYDSNFMGICIYPLSEYSEELAEKHREKKNDPKINPDHFNKKARELFGSGLILGNPFLR
jgi:poly-gamma-glutamate synthesis protein (capsule biosynthesis protein)